MDYTEPVGPPLPDEDHLLDPFESDNVHPRFYQILSKETADKYQEDLKHAQDKVRTLFPKVNRRDRIQQELDAIKVRSSILLQYLARSLSFSRRVKVSTPIQIV